MTKDLARLLQEREALDKRIETTRSQQRQQAIADIKARMAEHGVTTKDLADGPLYRSDLPPQYRDDRGNTWTGQGRRPKWLRDALLAGKSLSDFKVRA